MKIKTKDVLIQAGVDLFQRFYDRCCEDSALTLARPLEFAYSPRSWSREWVFQFLSSRRGPRPLAMGNDGG